MTEPKNSRVGLVSVREGRTSKRQIPYFELRYVDPATGREVKRRLQCVSVDEAAGISAQEARKRTLREIREVAEHLDREARVGRGYLPARVSVPTIDEALAEAIRLSTASAFTKKRYLVSARQFSGWINKEFPSVTTWDQLRPAMVQRWIRELEDAGLAWDSVRNAVFVVKLTWRVMSENYDSIRPLPRLRLKPKAVKQVEHLSAGELMTLLDWLQVNEPQLWPMACLQGLAGLRTMEAAALRRQDVDLRSGTISVSETATHKPKTRSSHRTVPITRELAQVLKEVMETSNVGPETGELFYNKNGKPHTLNGLSLRWSAVFKRARKSVADGGCGLEKLRRVSIRKLRSTFVNLVRECGCQDRHAVQVYVGHAQRDVLGQHYEAIRLDELRPIAKALNRWRTVAKKELARKHSGKFSHRHSNER